MTTRKQVLALAERMGATVKECKMMQYECDGEITVMAPEGQRWACSAVVELVATYGPDEPKAAAWADLHERMSGGLEGNQCNSCGAELADGICEPCAHGHTVDCAHYRMPALTCTCY